MPTDNDFPAPPPPAVPQRTWPRTEFHVSAHDARGSSVPEPIWRDMDQYADCQTLAQAREWAHQTIAADPRVSSCEIRESVQPFKGSSWMPGRHLETISRPPEGQELRNLAQEVRTVGLQPAPLRALPPHLRAARRSGR